MPDILMVLITTNEVKAIEADFARQARKSKMNNYEPRGCTQAWAVMKDQETYNRWNSYGADTVRGKMQARLDRQKLFV